MLADTINEDELMFNKVINKISISLKYLFTRISFTICFPGIGRKDRVSLAR